jgi:hypothetical protein
MKKGVVIAFLVVAFVVGVFVGVFYGKGITGAATDPPFPFPPDSDETKPTATIIAPSNGATVSGEIVVRATATDDSMVAKVEFLLDGVVAFTDTIPTAEGVYQWLLDTSTLPNGQHMIAVAPYDNAGNFNDLTKITIQVQNAGAAAGAQQPAAQQRPPTRPLQQTTAPVKQPAVVPAVPRAEQRSPADTSDSSEPDKAKYPLWITLVSSFGVIILVSGLLVFTIQKIRAVPEVPESIKTYVSVSMQQGYPVAGIHTALKQQGWDDKVIEEAFKDAMGENASPAM